MVDWLSLLLDDAFSKGLSICTCESCSLHLLLMNGAKRAGYSMHEMASVDAIVFCATDPDVFDG
jgi:hypothetical protein